MGAALAALAAPAAPALPSRTTQQTSAELLDSMRQVTSPLHRGSGWLDVLTESLARASDRRVPMLERARLLAVFSLHLDNFFMIRGAGTRTGPAGTATVRSGALLRRGPLHDLLQMLTTEHDRLLHDVVLPALAADGLGFPRWDDLNDLERKRLREQLRDVIHPLITPLVVDAAHPFPHVSALSLNLAVLVGDRDSGMEKFVCVQVPTRLSGFVPVDARRQVCIDALVSASLGELFQGMEILERSSFRVTRNQEFAVDDNDVDDDDGPRHVWPGSTIQQDVGVPVRLEVEDGTSARMLEILVRNLHVADDEVYRVRAPLGMAGTMLAVTDDLFSASVDATEGPTRDDRPRRERRSATHWFGSARRRSPSVMLPPSTYATSLRAFLAQATDDPAVQMIAQTLSCRRTDSGVVDALIDAAEAGKQVLVVLESRARDREPGPSTLGRRLARAGCQVVSGLPRVGGACALGLAIREVSGEGVRWFAHLGTPGHYPWTEGDPSELGFISADPDVCADVAQLLLRLAEPPPQDRHPDRPGRRFGRRVDPEHIDLAQ